MAGMADQGCSRAQCLEAIILARHGYVLSPEAIQQRGIPNGIERIVPWYRRMLGDEAVGSIGVANSTSAQDALKIQQAFPESALQFETIERLDERRPVKVSFDSFPAGWPFPATH